MSAGRRITATLANLALAAFSLALVLGAFEAGLRLAGYRALYEMYSKPSLFWQYDALLGWSHEPGARGRYVGPRPWPVEFQATVSINALGLRGEDVQPARGGEARVLFVGDSMVAGFEVEENETFVALLGRDLSARLGRPVRTINAGVRGYGTDQYLLYYEERGRALAPDVLVVFHSGNDPSDNTTLHETRRPFGKPALAPNGHGDFVRLGSPVPRYDACEEVTLSPQFEVVRRSGVGLRLFCRAQLALFDHSALFSFLTISLPWDGRLLTSLYHLGNPHAEVQADPDRAWRNAHASALLVALTRAARVDGAAVVLTGAPLDLAALDVPGLEAAGATLRDLRDVWDLPQEQIRFVHDSHFNPEGHRRVAAILAPALEAALRSGARPAEVAVR